VTPLPPPLGSGDLRLWRLDAEPYAGGWADGEGAFRFGGRWNRQGTRTVYAALDPATAALEVAVHKGFAALDRLPHVLTSARIADPVRDVHVVWPDAIPNPNWLAPILPNPQQQAFGEALLAAHRFILIPSAVSRHSWCVIFDGARGASGLDEITQERFALDPRVVT
jgi:RES domain-containing protein